MIQHAVCQVIPSKTSIANATMGITEALVWIAMYHAGIRFVIITENAIRKKVNATARIQVTLVSSVKEK